MRVSVIIPCYRQAKWLQYAVTSALEQTRPPHQVIVVNDGSDDDAEAVAAKFGRRITYRWKPNGGLSSARNDGLDAATGEFVVFLDADDLLAPTALETLGRALPGPDGLAVGGYRDFRADPARDARPPVFPPDGRALPQLFSYNLAPVHCWLAPRRAIEDAGRFDTSLRSLEDWHLWIRLLLRGHPLVRVPAVVAYYRRYEGSMSTQRDAMFLMRLKVLADLIGWIDGDARLRQQWGDDVFSAVRETVRSCLARGTHSPATAALYSQIRRVFRGRRARQSLFGWAVRELTGYAGEKATLAALRALRPAVLRKYTLKS